MRFRITAINIAVFSFLYLPSISIAEVIPEGLCQCTTTAMNPPPTVRRDGQCEYHICEINEACSTWESYNGKIIVDIRPCSSEELNPSWPPQPTPVDPFAWRRQDPSAPMRPSLAPAPGVNDPYTVEPPRYTVVPVN